MFFGIITVFDVFQDYFSCGMNILREIYFCGLRQLVLLGKKLNPSLND